MYRNNVMRQRFRPRRNFRKRFSNATKSDDELVMAISAARMTSAVQNIEREIEYVPKHRFEDFPICDQLKRNIAYKGYGLPTPIQDQSIPVILEGRDIIGIANTGTGKTAAFLIPLIDKVSKNKSEKVLIVTPTRELALQIRDELFAFSRGLEIQSALCVGGLSMWVQQNELRHNPNFVIGTPGRIRDLIGQRCLDLSQFHNVVIDEADRMVDIGFIGDIKYFISLLAQNRQSLFFSATISGKVKEILQTFVRNPITISVKIHDLIEKINQDIVRVVNREQKVDQLHDLLIQEGFDKVLIFGRTKWGIQKLTNELIRRGFKAGAIHGNKSQSQRQKMLGDFKRNQIKILLATDVASRGLDIEDVSHVINYDLPSSYDDYIHRIGRTGRANKSGVALTFVE